MSNGFLRVEGEKVVDEKGNTVILRGAGLGGWMNMENFITGYPGHEFQHRAAMLQVLGKEKQEFFFDKFLEYFFMEDDAKFFASLGLNCIRLPFNYRHFEDDMNPRVLKKSGFKHLDRVIDLCTKHKIYTILDMHALPGGQNPDWHSDSGSNYAAFWDQKDYQDRAVWLWEQIPTHYKSNPWVAGYNPLNEPCDALHHRLPAFYDRIEPVIRAIDPHHILWLDGNTFAMEWKSFTHVLPNAAYSIHDYAAMGFPSGERFKGTPEQISSLERTFLRKASFMQTHKVVAWNGEFGPDRYNLLGAQLKIYDKYQIPWSIWLYKDIGVQGMVYTNPDSLWNKTIQPFLEKKRRLQLDSWGKYPSAEISALISPLAKFIDEVCPEATNTYPTPWNTQRHLARAVMETFMAQAFALEFAGLFKDFSLEELDEAAKSFRFDRCVQREGLNKIMSEHAKGREA
ncbi:glycoside hydrolase family 5 protein [Hyaloscypha variabilis F]|uniref:Glycoside hydrolase family 5 protein n=1 Tax=Hyaloscypha variabilis (strain UAMH 11265 / GT02V1 / F) TaxID=1149755 RepID=A0A2J6RCS9_HYAVF|nr:glycoside hydrolase family 5 protein [Hyaloscypha variabilis F]